MWTMENTLQLIEDLSEEQCLWQVNSLDYKNRALKYESFTKLAAKHGMTPSEMEKKIQSLKSQFRREHRKMLEADRIGAPRRQCQWFGYKPLLFLKNGFEARRESKTCDSAEIKIENSVDFTEHIDAEDSVLDEDEVDYIREVVDNHREFQTPVPKIQPLKRKTKSDNECKNGSYKCMKTLIDVVTKRDQYSVYGEHIANKLRTCKRNSLEVNIAQHHLDNVLFNLAMGAYSQEACSKTDVFMDGEPLRASGSNDFNHVLP